MSDYKVPKGYVLIAEDTLRAWGKLEEVHGMCKYPVISPKLFGYVNRKNGKFFHEIDGVINISKHYQEVYTIENSKGD